MNKTFLFLLSLATLTIANIYIAIETSLYQDDATGLFVAFEIAAVASLSLVFAGLFVLLSLIWTLFNVLLLIVLPVYGWVPFVLVELLAVVFFLIGRHRLKKEDLAFEEEEQRQLEISEKLKEEGKVSLGTISGNEQVGYTQTGCEKTYEICLTVDATPADRMPFTCQVTTKVPFYDLATYRPGNMVKIRYMHDDPEICEFVEALDKQQASTQPVQEAPKQRPVVCPFCKSHFDLSGSSVCPNCGAPYVN